MLGIRHPFSKALYERHRESADDDGDEPEKVRDMIKVTEGDKVGFFTEEGEWISGELRFCDPQMWGWVAGPVLLNHRMSKAATDR